MIVFIVESPTEATRYDSNAWARALNAARWLAWGLSLRRTLLIDGGAGLVVGSDVVGLRAAEPELALVERLLIGTGR